jgi:hypothetical protein
MEASPFPLSSGVGDGPHAACGPPKEMKNTFRPATALHGSVAVPFVITSEAEGSAELQILGFAHNEQKIKPIESISISGVHFTLNLPQASQLLGMTKGRAAFSFRAVAKQKLFFNPWVDHRPMRTPVGICGL